MFIDDNSSQASAVSQLDLKHDLRLRDRLNKPLPPVRNIETTNADYLNDDPFIISTLDIDRPPPGSGRHIHDERSKMSLFNLFSRPKVERLRGYAEPGLSTPPLPQPTETRTSRRESRGDLRGARLEKPLPGTVRESSRPRPTPSRSPSSTLQSPSSRSPGDTFDSHHPPTFKQIFNLAVKIAPAHTCLIGASAKANAGWKVGSTLSLADGLEQWERPASRRSSRAPPASNTPQLHRKIFTLTRNGYLLQYADRGSSDRLPERVQRLTKDTCAIASDLVPGKPYTIQVAESMSVQDFNRPDSPSLLSRLGMKHGPPKRSIPSTVIVLDSPKELEEWLFAIRKEIQRQSKSGSPTSTPPRAYTPSPEKAPLPRRGSIPTTAALKELGVSVSTQERMDSPRQSTSQREKSRTLAPAKQQTDQHMNPRLSVLSDDADEADFPTATQMYHRQVMLTRQGSDAISSVSSNATTNKHRSMQSLMDGDRGSDAATVATSVISSPTKSDPKVSSEVDRDPKVRPFTPTSTVKTPTGLRQLSNPGVSQSELPVRNDSMTPHTKQDPSPTEREAAHLARMRKRASHHGPTMTAPAERPALRSVSSLGRLRAAQASKQEAEPLPQNSSMATMEQQSPPSTTSAKDGHSRTVMGNDEYHAFQQSMSVHPNIRGASRLNQGRRHSAMPSQSSLHSMNGSMPSSNTAGHEQVQRSMSREDKVSAQSRTLPPRLPFKLRAAVPPGAEAPSMRSSSARSAAGPMQPASKESPTSAQRPIVAAPPATGEPAVQKLRRPSSMQVRPSPTAFAPSQRTDEMSAMNWQSSILDRPRPGLQQSRSDHNLNATRQRHVRPPSNIAEAFSDDEDSFPIQNTTELDLSPGIEAKATIDGPLSLPVPDFGMPLVALGPPPPPPETPLPRPPPLSRPRTPQLAGH